MAGETEAVQVCSFGVDADSARIHEAEESADRQAAAWLLPNGVPDLPGSYVTRQRVEAAALEIGVSPAVVIGRLQRDGVVPWNSALNRIIPSVKGVLADWK